MQLKWEKQEITQYFGEEASLKLAWEWTWQY